MEYPHLPAGRALDAKIAQEVFSLIVSRWVVGGGQWRSADVMDSADYEDEIWLATPKKMTLNEITTEIIERYPLFSYSSYPGDMWLVVEEMASRMGDTHPGYRWSGPLYKPVQTYLTHEGYPLGTVCWYVGLEAAGMIQYIAADTAPEAVCNAALRAIQEGVGPVPVPYTPRSPDAQWRTTCPRCGEDLTVTQATLVYNGRIVWVDTPLCENGFEVPAAMDLPDGSTTDEVVACAAGHLFALADVMI
jgi:hypothetical protein